MKRIKKYDILQEKIMEDAMAKRRKRKKGGAVSLIIMIIALLVLLVSSIRFIMIQMEYRKGESEYEEIAKVAITTKEKNEEVQIDFDALREINKDVVAWIRFEEPKIINYPVVQGKDNSEYLTITFSGYDNTVGTLFVDVRNQNDFTDKHTLIYGHRMNNGTMFNELDNYKEEAYGKRYPYFSIYTPDGLERKYQIYSTEIVSEVSDIYTCSFTNEQEFKKFLIETRKHAFYNTDTEVTTKDQVLTLSTCTGDNKKERLVVHGVLIETKNQEE